jgi:hypothetical protein
MPPKHAQGARNPGEPAAKCCAVYSRRCSQHSAVTNASARAYRLEPYSPGREPPARRSPTSRVCARKTDRSRCRVQTQGATDRSSREILPARWICWAGRWGLSLPAARIMRRGRKTGLSNIAHCGIVGGPPMRQSKPRAIPWRTRPPSASASRPSESARRRHHPGERPTFALSSLGGNSPGDRSGNGGPN